jgi:hypothetical protein
MAQAARRPDTERDQADHVAADTSMRNLASAVMLLIQSDRPQRDLPASRPRLDSRGMLATAETNAADALHRCHGALERDGQAHSYAADDWLPVIYDTAAPLLESVRLDQEPPSLVRQTQEAVRWLSTSIACLGEDSPETPAAITDTLGRLLVVCVFADAACSRPE